MARGFSLYQRVVSLFEEATKRNSTNAIIKKIKINVFGNFVVANSFPQSLLGYIWLYSNAVLRNCYKCIRVAFCYDHIHIYNAETVSTRAASYEILVVY